MKKQYPIIILVVLLLYVLYLIGMHKVQEYKIRSNIEYIAELNTSIKELNEKYKKEIEYKQTLAFKNKMKKENSHKKNVWEIVIVLKGEKEYDKYARGITLEEQVIDIRTKSPEEIKIEGMTIPQRWKYFLFGVE